MLRTDKSRKLKKKAQIAYNSSVLWSALSWNLFYFIFFSYGHAYSLFIFHQNAKLFTNDPNRQRTKMRRKEKKKTKMKCNRYIIDHSPSHGIIIIQTNGLTFRISSQSLQFPNGWP